MLWLELRCTPRTGRIELAWLAELTGALDAIWHFLLRTDITAAVLEDPSAPPAGEAMARIVDRQAVQTGSPVVHLAGGGMVIELGAPLDNGTIAVRALAAMALLLRDGPDAAGWPRQIKAAWHSSADDAGQARRAYQRVSVGTVVGVVQSRSEPDLRYAHTQPSPVLGPLPERRTYSEWADLPPGVRRAKPL